MDPKRIMIVEDEGITALSIEKTLEKMGHEGNLEEAAAEYSKLEQEVEELHTALRETLSES